MITDIYFYKIELSDIVKYFDFIKSHDNDTFDPLFIRVEFNFQTNSASYTIKNVNKIEDFININDLNSNGGTFYSYYINKKFINTKTDNIENINFIEEADYFTTNNLFYTVWAFNAAGETIESLQTALSNYICIIVNVDNVNDLNRNIGILSHTEGLYTTASGNYSHAEGSYTIALNEHSHTGGNHTIADIDNMTVIGTYNKPTYNIYTNFDDTIYIVGNKDIYDIEQQENGQYKLTNKETGKVMTDFYLHTLGDETLQNKIFVIGNGTNNNNRSNAFVITNTGDVYISGTIHCKEVIHDM